MLYRFATVGYSRHYSSIRAVPRVAHGSHRPELSVTARTVLDLVDVQQRYIPRCDTDIRYGPRLVVVRQVGPWSVLRRNTVQSGTCPTSSLVLASVATLADLPLVNSLDPVRGEDTVGAHRTEICPFSPVRYRKPVPKVVRNVKNQGPWRERALAGTASGVGSVAGPVTCGSQVYPGGDVPPPDTCRRVPTTDLPGFSLI